jgi:ATP-dependent DNA helicase RecG
MKAVEYVKTKGKITNSEYQEINNVTEQTALRDIKVLIENNVFIKTGTNAERQAAGTLEQSGNEIAKTNEI